MESLFPTVLLGVTLICSLLVHKYAQREVPLRIKIVTVLSWMFCFLGYALLPLDIYFTTHHPDSPQRNSIEWMWGILYWGNFLMSWLVLPLIMAYESSGDFDVPHRLKRAVLDNLVYYLYFTLAALPLLAFIYFMRMLDRLNLLDLAVSASNSIGIFLCIICMSYSIPHLPVSLLKAPNKVEQLKKLQYEVSLSKHLLNNMKTGMVDHILKIRAFEAYSHVSPLHKKHLAEIKSKIPPHFYSKAASHIVASKADLAPVPTTEAELTALHRSVKTLREEITRLKMKQITLSRRAMFVEDVLDSSYQYSHRFAMIPSCKEFGNSKKLRLRMAVTVWPWFSKILGVFCAFLSTVLIVVEVLGLCNKQIDDYLRDIISRRDNWIVASLSLAVFGYAIFCVHFAVFRFKFSGFYNLYYGQQTDTASLLYSGFSFARVSSALCLNFLSILNIENSSFNDVMGTFSPVPIFGETFQKFFPLTLLFFVVFNLTDVYGKVMKTLGLNKWEFTQTEGEDLQAEGKRIVHKHRLREQFKTDSIKLISTDSEEIFSPGVT